MKRFSSMSKFSHLFNLVMTKLGLRRTCPSSNLVMTKFISFPAHERDSVVEHLRKYGCVYTTKVGPDALVMYVNKTVVADFDPSLVLKVVEIKRFTDINQHPFLKHLTIHERELISSFPYYLLVKLRKMNEY